MSKKVVVIAVVEDCETWTFSRIMYMDDPTMPDWEDLVKKMGDELQVEPHEISEMFIVSDLIKHGHWKDWRNA